MDTDPGAPSVSVLMVSYETRELTCAAIASLFERAARSISEIVVLDNASTDGSAEAIATRFPGITVISSCDNLGFGRGMNEAANASSGDYLLLLNPDTVIHDDVVADLVAFARRRPDAGIWGGLALDEDGAPNRTSALGLPSLYSYLCWGSGFTSVFPRSRLFNPEILNCRLGDSEREVGVVTGCLLLLRRDLWTEIGGFDERYFMYGEDVDLCLRARRLGYRPAISPSIAFTHYGGGSSRHRADKRLVALKGRVTIARQYFGSVRSRLAVGALVTGVAVRAGANRVIGVVRPSSADPSWGRVHRRRKEWLRGYPSEPPVVVAGRHSVRLAEG
jgi:N-acetylglucosaminyl-diphospho-decaprenol L-rhamnosyltransferase